MNWPERESKPRLLEPQEAALEAASGLTAAERGSAIHRMLAEIPLRSCPEGPVLRWVGGIFPDRDRREIALIANFLESDLGRRLQNASRIERELEFSYPVSAGKLLGEATEEPILLQGVIDCCFMEDGHWVLIDYKTDRVPPWRAREQAQQHRQQLSLYAEALSAISGIPVGEQIVALLRAGENIRVDLDEGTE